MDTSPADDDIKPRSPLPGIIIAVILIGGAVAGIAAMRSNAAKQKAEADRKARIAAADSAAAAARADSIRLATQDTSKVATASPSPAPGKRAAGAATKPVASTTTKPATSTTSATAKPAAGAGGASASAGASAAPKPAAAGPFGIDVGTFLDEDKANTESTRLGSATALAAKVVTKTEDGASVYHVVLGSFPSRSAAEKKSETLVAKGLVNEAHIVPVR